MYQRMRDKCEQRDLGLVVQWLQLNASVAGGVDSILHYRTKIPLLHAVTNIFLKANLGASQVVLVVKNLPANAGDMRDLDLGRSPGGGHGNPFQYSCLENPMDCGAWWAIVHTITKSRT